MFTSVDLINKNFVMRKYFFLLISSFVLLSAPDAQLTTLPDGGNKKAMVAERIGITDVVIN